MLRGRVRQHGKAAKVKAARVTRVGGLQPKIGIRGVTKMLTGSNHGCQLLKQLGSKQKQLLKIQLNSQERLETRNYQHCKQKGRQFHRGVIELGQNPQLKAKVDPDLLIKPAMKSKKKSIATALPPSF